MLLVPRQLLRSGMTGSVPYYGGRFTPAQAWAAAHPTASPMGSSAGGPAVAAVRRPQPPAQAEAPSTDEPATKAALRQLRESGVLTGEEYDELLRRTNG
ncbi:MAG TPA: hypothetical protein VE462_17260 [Propionibacteriaceae bacterium]|jgi:hypothetical protein|nr:hypothetical protein [Propionibacteriaceae bacterium]